MIVNYLVVAALVGGQPTATGTAPSLGTRTSAVNQPTDYQVLPALGISGSKSSPKTPDAVAAKYSTGATDWTSTRLVAAQQPAPPSEPPPLMENEPATLPPASSTEPAPPAAVPPAPMPPAVQAAPEASATPEANPPADAPNIDAELEAVNPKPVQAEKAPAGEGESAERPDLMEQDVYFRSPCVCIYEPWEMASFYANTRSVFLWRDLSKDVTVLVDGNTNAPLVNTGDLDLPMKWGQEFLLGWQIDSAHALEVSYMWFADATSSQVYNNPAGIANIPFQGLLLDAINDVTHQEVHLKSQLWNFELNAINLMRDGTDSPWRTSFFLGARIIGIEESFGQNSINVNGNRTNGDIRAENALYGGQLGVRVTHRELLPKLNVDLVAKGGVFGNIIDSRISQQATQGAGQVGFQTSDDGTSHVSQAVEGGIEGVYKLRQNIHLTFGYRALFVARIARATDQINFIAQFPQLQDNGDIFYHGFTAGIRIFWGQRTDPNCRSGCCTPYIVTSGCCP